MPMAPISFPFFNIGTLSSDLARKSSAVATRHASPSAYARSARVSTMWTVCLVLMMRPRPVSGPGQIGPRAMYSANSGDAKLGERGIGAVLIRKQYADLGPAEAGCAFQHGLGYRPQLARRAADDAQQLRGRQLLFQRLAQFAGERLDFLFQVDAA